MRRATLVTYDIADPKRLRLVHRLMRGYGDRVQFSVFYCELSRRERVELEERLTKTIHAREDQILLIDLGRAEGRGAASIQALGKRYAPSEHLAVIV